jgi:iron complex outermembrane recepter protein
MRPQTRRLSPVAGAVLALTLHLAAQAQVQAQTQTQAPATTPAPPQGETIVVQGLRASLLKGEQLKRNAVGVVDSINAEDIGKFADRSLGEAAQRIPGMQVERNNGEVQRVTLRGLPDVATTLDGMDFYTGQQRRFSYQDLPIIAVGRIDVRKTWTADLIEGGGMAGVIDTRLRRPFDQPGFVASGYVTARAIDAQGSSAKTTTNATGGLVLSNRWNTDIGQVGVMFSGSYFDEEWSAPFMNMLTGDPQRVYLVNRTTGAGTLQTAPASGIYPAAPAGSVLAEMPGYDAAYNFATRQRSVAHAGLQWRPDNRFEFNSHAIFIDFHGLQKNSVLVFNPRQSPTISNAVVGAGDAANCTTPIGTICPLLSATIGTTAAQPIVNSSLRSNDLTTRNHQLGVDGRYREGALKVAGNVMYSQSKIYNHGYTVNLVPRAANGTLLRVGGTIDNTDGQGAYGLTGFDPNADNAWRFGTYQENWTRNYGKQGQANADAEYALDAGPLSAIKAGVRLSKRTAGSWGNTSANFALPATASAEVPAGSLISLPGMQRNGGAFQAISTDFVFDNVDLFKARFGVPAGELPENPTQRYGVDEKNAALFVNARLGFDIGSIEVRGDAGVRGAQVRRTITANQVNGTTVTGRFERNTSETALLPSLALVFSWTPQLQTQLGLNKTLSYPNFVDLSPGVALTAPAVGNPRGTGTGGNPELQALESKNIDASLEYYFARNGYVAGGVFYRDIEGYVQRFDRLETYGGIDYNVSRPQNAGKGRLSGFELSAQRFFDFLPEPFDKFGAMASFTYIDGKNQSKLADGSFRQDPLTQVSRESYTLVGMYEGYGLTTRLAWTYRGEYTEALAGGSMNLPVVTKGAGTLDLGIGYKFNETFSVQFDASNLTGTNLEQYRGDPARPQQLRYNPKFYQLGLRVKL